MNFDKIRNYAYLVILLLGGGFILYFAASKLLSLTLPFLIAWCIAFAVRPVSHKVSKKIKIPVRFVSLFFSLLTVLGTLGAIIGIFAYAAREAWNFLSELAAGEEIYNIVSNIISAVSSLFGRHDGAGEIEEKISEMIREILTSFLGSFVSGVSAFVSEVPTVVIFIFISIVATVYFSLDLDGINGRVRRILPKRIADGLVSFKNRFLSIMLLYLRSYFTIMAIVFIILLFGFIILGVEYALMLALLFAVLDMLPLIGVGSFMIPWAIFSFMVGDPARGIGLLVLFVITEVTRNLVEPKIVGKNLGIHPILTLVMLYFSYSLFGFFGLFLTPIFTVILNAVINKNDTSEVGEGIGGK